MTKFKTVPPLKRSLAVGSIGFALVSLCVFATVAFAGMWMYTRLGMFGAYLTWIALFVLLGGGVLGSLVVGFWQLPRFYLLFAVAFSAYAAGWMGAYFSLGGKLGEWTGALAGSFLMTTVFALGFRAAGSALILSALLFVANSIGYFLGSMLNDFVGGSVGMLFWGITYGLGLGAGLGAVLHLAQVRGRRPAEEQ